MLEVFGSVTNIIAIITESDNGPPSVEYSNKESLRYKDWQLLTADSYMPYNESLTKQKSKLLLEELDRKYPTKKVQMKIPVNIQQPEVSQSIRKTLTEDQLEESLELLKHSVLDGKAAYNDLPENLIFW